METAGIRELKQNASAVIARAAQGETIVITDRGVPVAQVTPLPGSAYGALKAAGRIRPAKRSLRELGRAEPGEPVSPVLEAMRQDERY